MAEKRTIRVFPRRTRATPVDRDARTGFPDFWDHADEILVSVTFTWDLPWAERLAKEWERAGPVQIGGPATNQRGEEFTPGKFLKPGYTITSRGCPNQCWFCSVWRRDGPVRELPVQPGHNILDDNLLACSRPHIEAVFEMLKHQPQPVEFTGGLEAARLQPWHVDLLADLRPKQFFFAYDTPDDLEPLQEAGRALDKARLIRSAAGHPNHRGRAYVLIGYPRDTMDKAGKRLRATYKAGFLPMAMLWRDGTGGVDKAWRQFQRAWAAPQAVYRQCRAGRDTPKGGPLCTST